MAAPFTLLPLPYSEDALEPVISAKTVGLHYHKHHKGYVDTLNKLVEGTRFAGMTVDAITRETFNASEDAEKKIFNNAGQIWNHDFYWRSMSPNGGGPGGDLKDAIERDFGSADALIGKLVDAGKEQFGSGWVWLVSKGGKLSVEKTPNALNPMTKDINCLLGIDVWEHAYYLDYQNERPRYLQSVLPKLIAWDFAHENFEKDAHGRAGHSMTKTRYGEIRQDVGKTFRRPEEIAQAENLSQEQKIDLLKEWEIDLRQLMVASEENMAGAKPGQTAELLQHVRQSLAHLGAPDHESAAVNKTGG